MLATQTPRNLSNPFGKIKVAVERKIFFYRIYSGVDSSNKPIPFDTVQILTHINKLDWKNNERYLFDSEGKCICCWVDKIETPSKVRVGLVRRADLPQVEESGILSPLLIPLNSGLVESIHVMFFDNDIVGADYNFYGPTIKNLDEYISKKADGIAPKTLLFEQLLRKDAVNQIKNVKEIRLFQLKIRASYADTVSKANKSLGEAFKAAANAGRADEIEIILRPKSRSKKGLSDKLVNSTKKLLGFDSLQYEAAKFVIEGYDDHGEKIRKLDLLNDKFIAKKQIVRQDERSRALNPEAAFEAIKEAYIELKDQLIKAPSSYYE